MSLREELETLLQERLRIADQIASLHPIYGPNGTYFTRREILEAQLRKKHRQLLESNTARVTAALTDEQVKTDPEYVTFVTEAEQGKEQLFRLYTKLKDITFRIQWLLRAPTDPDDETDLGGEV